MVIVQFKDCCLSDCWKNTIQYTQKRLTNATKLMKGTAVITCNFGKNSFFTTERGKNNYAMFRCNIQLCS